MMLDIIEAIEKGTLIEAEYEEYTERKEEILEALETEKEFIFLIQDGVFYCNIQDNTQRGVIEEHGLTRCRNAGRV